METEVASRDEARDGVCGVCGGVLEGPLAACPSCDALHHHDCWDYNDGCSVYGCPARAADLALVEQAAEEVLAPTRPWEAWAHSPLAPVFALALGAAGLFAALDAAGLAPPLALLLGTLLMAGAWRRVRPPPPEEDPLALPSGPDDGERKARETKAVLAHLDADAPHELAQAYALFEQRRPRARLPGDAQLRLGLELAEAGYRVLAAEALEKACGRGGAVAAAGIEAYQRLFSDDPAFAREALAGPPATWSEPPVLVAQLGPSPAVDGDAWLLSLGPEGFPAGLRRALCLPGDPPEAESRRGRWVLGPYPEGEAGEAAAEARSQGHAGVLVTAAELRLAGEPAEVTALGVTSKGLRVETAEGAAAFPWDEVRALVYARMARVEKRSKIQETTHYGPRGAQSSSYVTQTQEETRHDSVLEVHVGEPPRRFRIQRQHPGLFAYLGRRRELAYETNLRFAAKDLARFAPHARASRGLVAMVSVRQARERSFADPQELEERVGWFHALGAPRLRAWWREQIGQR